MTTRPLPKSIQKACATKYADRFDEGWTEADHSDGVHAWSHWVYLKKGWYNYRQDPYPGLHTIHESSVAEVLAQLREARPYDEE